MLPEDSARTEVHGQKKFDPELPETRLQIVGLKIHALDRTVLSLFSQDTCRLGWESECRSRKEGVIEPASFRCHGMSSSGCPEVCADSGQQNPYQPSQPH